MFLQERVLGIPSKPETNEMPLVYLISQALQESMKGSTVLRINTD